jgi:hypothetical protein
MSPESHQGRVSLQLEEEAAQIIENVAAEAGLSLSMNPGLDDEMFEYVDFGDIPEPLEQKARYLAAKAGVSLSLFPASVLSRYVAKCEGDTCGDYRYSRLP